MSTCRVALANLPFPASPEDSVARAEAAIAEAGARGADLVCFPEAYVPGYRLLGHQVPDPDPSFLEGAWARVAAAAARAGVAVILGTERMVDDGLRLSALVVDRDGTVLGWQDKVQLDPSEDDLYTPGAGRQVFRTGHLAFGVVICHEGWRYPETVRAAVRHGAQVVFHPHLHEAEPGSYRPTTFADPANTFHEKAALCRAAENTCYFATVNCASEGSGTTSAIARPDGSLLCHQPYGEAGLLVADLDLREATGLLAGRLRQAQEAAGQSAVGRPHLAEAESPGVAERELPASVTVFVLTGESYYWVGVTTDLRKRIAGLGEGRYTPHALRGRNDPLRLALTVGPFPSLERSREAQVHLESLGEARLHRLVQGGQTETAALLESFSDLSLSVRHADDLEPELQSPIWINAALRSRPPRSSDSTPKRAPLSPVNGDEAFEPQSLLADLQSRFPPRDWGVLTRRVRDGDTMQQIADDLGVTRERVRQIAEKMRRRVFSDLRRHLGARWLDLAEIYDTAQQGWGFLSLDALLDEVERIWRRELSAEAREDCQFLFHFLKASGAHSQMIEGRLVYSGTPKNVRERLLALLAAAAGPAGEADRVRDLRLREVVRFQAHREPVQSTTASVDAVDSGEGGASPDAGLELIGRSVSHPRYGSGRVVDIYTARYRPDLRQVMVRFANEPSVRVVKIEDLSWDRSESLPGS